MLVDTTRFCRIFCHLEDRNMKNKVLPEFQEYLRAKNPVREKYILFYAHWARKFFAFSNNKKWKNDMKGFKQLNVWVKASKLTRGAYHITTFFPKDELYGLTSQIRRAAASIPTNIAGNSSVVFMKQ